MANVSRSRALNEPKTAKLAEMRAEFCIFESSAPGLKANFYEPYVDKPTRRAARAIQEKVGTHKEGEIFGNGKRELPISAPQW